MRARTANGSRRNRQYGGRPPSLCFCRQSCLALLWCFPRPIGNLLQLEDSRGHFRRVQLSKKRTPKRSLGSWGYRNELGHKCAQGVNDNHDKKGPANYFGYQLLKNREHFCWVEYATLEFLLKRQGMLISGHSA